MIEVVSAEDRELKVKMVHQETFFLLRELERRRCEKDFAFFARQGWHVLEPGIEYVHGPHIEAIVDHLNATLPRWIPASMGPSGTWDQTMPGHYVPGQILELLINMPFRHMKSTLLTLWSAWVWTTRPEFRFLFSSYSLGLAIRDTMRMRAIIQSPWYFGLWGNKYRLRQDQNRKDKFYNTAMGYRISASLDSGATGEGGDTVVVDDPMNVSEADSVIVREKTDRWWFETMSTRKNSPALSSMIVVGQRVHKYDLSASCKEKGYTVLELPAEYNPARSCVTVIGWKDWRSEEGELLWPQRFTPVDIEKMKNTLGPFGAACQLQQNPQPRGGAFIKREWFNTVSSEYMKTVHGSIAWVRVWDLAIVKTGHRCASVEMGQDADGKTYVRRGLFWREDWAESLPRIEAVGKHEKNRVVVESIGTTKSAGEDVERVLRGSCIVTLLVEKTNKVSEAIAWTAAAQAHEISFVEENLSEWPYFEFNPGPWIEHFLDIFSSWIPDPFLDQEDDEVDVMSMGWAATRSMVPLDRALASGAVVGSRYGNLGGFR